MRVFIAGATGVLGRRIVRQLAEKSHEVVSLARDEQGRRTIRRLGGEAVIRAATAVPAKDSGDRSDGALNDRLRREGARAAVS